MYSKEENEFLDRELKRLSENYPKLDIFNRQNNPYLQYKDNFENTKEYKELQNKKEWWQNHILTLLEQNDNITIFKDENENQDIVLFVLISLYFEIPIAYEYHLIYNKLKELDKIYLAKRNKTMHTLKNIRQEISENIYPYLNLKSSSYKSQEDKEPSLRILLNRMFHTIDEVHDILSYLNNDEIDDYHYINTMNYGYNYNEIWTRNLHDKTGLRQTVLRQIALLLDLIYHNKYKSFNKPIYQLLEYVMPCDNDGMSMIYNLTQDEVYKVIKGISYYDDYKNYSHVFDGYKKYYLNQENSKINTYIQKWKEYNLSYKIFDKLIQELIETDKYIDKADLE